MILPLLDLILHLYSLGSAWFFLFLISIHPLILRCIYFSWNINQKQILLIIPTILWKGNRSITPFSIERQRPQPCFWHVSHMFLHSLILEPTLCSMKKKNLWDHGKWGKYMLILKLIYQRKSCDCPYFTCFKQRKGSRSRKLCEGEVGLTPYGARNRHSIARGSHCEDHRFKGSIILS